MWDYSKKVKDHFFHPRNVGEIENPDGVGEVGSMACGDALKLTFKLDEAGRIADARFKTFGCASAIASASALTELLKGKTIEEAEQITNQDIAEYLDGLPEQKMHCSVMGREALQAAVHNYRTGQKASQEMEGELVCVCFGVTDKTIENVVRENNLTTVEQVTNYCKAGGGCGGCKDQIRQIIAKVRGEPIVREEPSPTTKRMTNIEKIRLVQDTIEREIRPLLLQDGGDLELIDVDGDRVLVAFRGTCAQCRVAEFTLKDVVENRLREFVSEDLVVQEVKP